MGVERVWAFIQLFGATVRPSASLCTTVLSTSLALAHRMAAAALCILFTLGGVQEDWKAMPGSSFSLPQEEQKLSPECTPDLCFIS